MVALGGTLLGIGMTISGAVSPLALSVVVSWNSVLLLPDMGMLENASCLCVSTSCSVLGW